MVRAGPRVAGVSDKTESLFARNELASEWMHRGMDLAKEDSALQLKEAISCFDEAIALRRNLPLEDIPWFRYGLSAGWVNRADALARLGDGESLAEALKSYDEALALLQALHLLDNPLYPRRLAITWINRGVAWQKLENSDGATEAACCFREALAVLDHTSAKGIEDRDLLRAGAWSNLAGVLLSTPDGSLATTQRAMREACMLVKDVERTDLIAAETGLKARRILCRAIAAEFADEKAILMELVAEATDALDEGLELARHWELSGETRFRQLAREIFCFGCRIYQVHQPQFLAEFILESLDPEKTKGVLPLDEQLLEAARAAVLRAFKEIQRGEFQNSSTAGHDKMLANLQELRVTEARLEQLGRATER